MNDTMRSLGVPATIAQLVAIFGLHAAHIKPGIGFDDWRYKRRPIDPRAMHIAAEFVGWDRKHCRPKSEAPHA